MFLLSMLMVSYMMFCHGLNEVKCWMTEEELKEEEALLNEEEILGIGLPPWN